MVKSIKRQKSFPSRRSFLYKGITAAGVAGTAGAAGAAVITGQLSTRSTFAKGESNSLTKGDIAMLRFLAATEFIETDLWQQYNELGGIQDKEVPGGKGSAPYTKALQVLDSDMSQYLHDNTDDEFSHLAFLNAYLISKGADPVDLSKFRTLPSSKATGAQQIGRLTNLMQLTIDTSFWSWLRSDTKNPDLGDTFTPVIPGLLKGQFPAIPRNDGDLISKDHLQAIANTAAFHFAWIEQGGAIYMTLAQKATNPEVLSIMLSIGPVEIMHFQTWHDKAGNAPPLIDPTNGLVFPKLQDSGNENTQANLILPEPTVFLNRKFPPCAVMRPLVEVKGAAVGAVKAFTDDGLFRGQSPEFFKFLQKLAEDADAAQPGY